MSAVQESLPSEKDKPGRAGEGGGAGTSSKTKAKKEPPTLWQRATFRWTAITAVMAVLLVLYTKHPYYQGGQFQPWRSYYPIAFVTWLVLGLFYIRATLEKFQGMRYTVRDGGLHLLILGRSLLRKGMDPEEASRRMGSAVRSGVIAGIGFWVVCAFGRFIGATTFTPEIAIGAGIGVKGTVQTFVVGAVILLGSFAVLGLVYYWLAEHARYGRFWKTIKNRRLRTTVLGIVVKGFFTPLMLGFFSGHARTILDLWFKHKHLTPFKFVPPLNGNAFEQLTAWLSYLSHRIPEALPSGTDFVGLVNLFSWSKGDISWGLDVAYNFVFFVDCGTALIGYSLESRWLGNKTRSVEPTFFGWSVALACYPPFNNVLGTYLPLDNGPSLIASEDMHLAFRAATVVLFTIYASATVAFGFKFSNLTNRGIISRGPYKYIRHPAYVTKCTAWWLEHLPTMTFTKAIFLTGLCSVYALRAWTEERHLSRDPEYVAYKKKTPWVILPRVF